MNLAKIISFCSSSQPAGLYCLQGLMLKEDQARLGTMANFLILGFTVTTNKK